MKPIDLHSLRTHELASRPSSLFVEDLGTPTEEDVPVSCWLDSLPRSPFAVAATEAAGHLTRAMQEGRRTLLLVSGAAVRAGCGSYLADWLRKGFIGAVALAGDAAWHDLELAQGGKTGEDACQSIPAGKLGLAREAADAFAVAALQGSKEEVGLGTALAAYLAEHPGLHPEASILLAAHQSGASCTVHTLPGIDAPSLHAHVSPASLGEAAHVDFRKLCTALAGLDQGLCLTLGECQLLDVLGSALSTVRNLGHSLEGTVSVLLRGEAWRHPLTALLERMTRKHVEVAGPLELMVPVVYQMVACRLASSRRPPTLCLRAA